MKKSITIKNKIDAVELIKASRFRNDIRKTEPHKHNNYFEIIYLLKGNGTHTIDHTCFLISTPTLFLVRKEQVHHWDITDEPEGYVLLLKKNFMDVSLDAKLKDLLSKLSRFNCMHLGEISSIQMLFELLITEKDFIVTEGILKALLAKILIVTEPVSIERKKTNDLTILFRELLFDTNDLRNNVSYYARLLNTTPQNLNAYCRRSLNQSATDVIAEHIITEAKRQLIYTGNTVSEIAYNLNFNDTSHFVKYFKRHTYLTPQTFRNK